MPNVPQRNLSYGENLNKLRPSMTIICRIGTKDVPKSEESRTKRDGVVKTHPIAANYITGKAPAGQSDAMIQARYENLNQENKHDEQ